MPATAKILELIERDPALSALRDEAARRLHDDPGHDVFHCLRVAAWAVHLADGAVAPRLVIAAALLHDIVNLPKDSPERARASELSAGVALELLPPFGFAPEEARAVADAVRDHSYSRGAIPASLLGKALQDADRLEALGALGIMRTIATGVRMGAAFFHPEDPWAIERTLDDRGYSIDHFFTKLLGLPATMQTARGRSEAERRARIMHDFLEQLGVEIGAPRAS
jgi:uncharacterized protein